MVMVNLDKNLDNERIVKILYKNYRGETRIRTIIPLKIWFGNTKWHSNSQWLLDAFDVEKQANRSFAMVDIKSWFVE